MDQSDTEITARSPLWRQVLARDRAADGVFWYSVASTGVYCRPSCLSRPAKPQNVRFHASIAAAREAGFRACRRCNPDGITPAEANAAIIAKTCRLIDAAEAPPALTEMAAAADLSPAYFHRLFKAVTGVTPRQYAAASRAKRVRDALADSTTVTEAIYDSGFNSSGRFYGQAPGMLGMAPRRYREGGAGEELRFAIGQCALGAILVASSAQGVAAISLGDDPDGLLRTLQDQFPNATFIGGDACYEKLVARVIGFIEAPGAGFDLPMDIRGTAFQQRVWLALRDIPAGATISYTALANRIGAPKAVRAVASACAANVLAVAIPCHRVVRNDGALSGYRWGVPRKRQLLDRERAAFRGAPSFLKGIERQN